MVIRKELKEFILNEENQTLINLGTKEAWEILYLKIKHPIITSGLTEIMLSIDIDPANFIGIIPNNYLFASKIENYAIPNNVKIIEDDAFSYCSLLKQIIIPDGVESIGKCSFWRCNSLNLITIPNSVMSIGTRAFANCPFLNEIIYRGTKEEAINVLKVKRKLWRADSSISKIICNDGAIEL